MHPSTLLTIASLAAGATAARSMGYCMNSDRSGGDIGLTKFCCDSQFDFRLNEAGVCNIPADSCFSIAECCKTDFYVFNTCPDTFPCENSAVDKVCRRGSGYVDPGQPKQARDE
ncbi:hypothetical protein CGCSCA1_v010759 [Colletotrichum siamense]|nr:hypothetical protein CGCSCA1_v010759 [Colletotrichum siamense]